MSVSLPLPPTGRDFQVYQRVVLEAATTRQAASDFSLSETRIRQIVLRVSQWLAETLPNPLEADDAAYLRLAQHVAADRLQYVYGKAMHGWQLTNEAKYAGIVLRVINAHSRLPVIPGTLEALHADALHGPLPDDYVTPAPTAPPSTLDLGPGTLDSCPPPGDYSPTPTDAQPAPPTNATSVATTPLRQIPCDNVPPTQSAARRAFLAPAHSASGNGDSVAAEINLTPQSLSFAIQEKHSSRRDRRRLRRLAATR